MDMNRIILMGRLTKDPEIRYSQSDSPMPIARYSLAVDKKQKREDGITADFFNLVAFDRHAAFAEKYLRKGVKIAVSGHVNTGTYNNRDGVRMPFFEIIVEEQEFAERKSASRPAAPNDTQKTGGSFPVDKGGFMNIPDGIDEELPFN